MPEVGITLIGRIYSFECTSWGRVIGEVTDNL